MVDEPKEVRAKVVGLLDVASQRFRGLLFQRDPSDHRRERCAHRACVRRRAPAAGNGRNRREIVAELAQRPFNESISHRNGGEVYVLASIETSYAIPFI